MPNSAEGDGADRHSDLSMSVQHVRFEEERRAKQKGAGSIIQV